MKATDLSKASRIVGSMIDLAAKRSALSGRVLSGGVRAANSASTYVGASDAKALEEIRRAVLASLDREEAELRRLAAQISLTL